MTILKISATQRPRLEGRYVSSRELLPVLFQRVHTDGMTTPPTQNLSNLYGLLTEGFRFCTNLTYIKERC